MALTENELFTIRKLDSIASTIYNYYKVIKKQELEGNVSQTEYDWALKNIKDLNAIEEECYASLATSNEKVSEIVENIFKRKTDLTLGQILGIAEMENKLFLIQFRMALKLREALNKKCIITYKEDITKHFLNPNYSKNIEALSGLHNAALDDDLYDSLYIIVDKYLKDQKYESNKEYICNLKYNLSYLWPSIETNNINCDFQEFPLIWSHEMYRSLLNLPKETLGIGTIEGMCQFFLNILIEDLFGVNKQKMSDEKVISALIYFRTSLMFAPKSAIEDLKQKFILTVVHNREKHGNLEIEQQILEVLDSCLKDKEIVQIVNFNNNLNNRK